MVLVLILLFLTLIFSLIRFSFIILSQPISIYLHSLCLKNLPSSSHKEDLAALVCGDSYDQLAFSDFYKSTGLIHLFVVSGSHFVILNGLLMKLLPFKKKEIFILSGLIIYSSICLNTPPAVRGVIALLIQFTLDKVNLKWPKHTQLLIVGLLCLSLNYTWSTSLSLQMSWLTSLVLIVFENVSGYSKAFKRQLCLFFLMTFCFAIMGQPQLISTLTAVLFTPLLDSFLFPLALISAVFHPFVYLFDFCISTLQSLLLLTEATTVASNHIYSYSFWVTLNWLLILSIHLYLILKSRQNL